jgi:type IV fimbrial biogenesis protein FimT
MQRKSQIGFTLIELMVTVAVLAILAAIAVPNLRSFILSNALSSATSELRSVLARARVEAINRASIVTVTPGATSGSSVIGWSDGYKLFVNPLNSLAYSAGQQLGSGTDKKRSDLLQQGEFYGTNVVSITSSGGVGGALKGISYGSDGRTVQGAANNANGKLILCVDPAIVTSENARVIDISLDGRVSITRDTMTTCPVAA